MENILFYALILLQIADAVTTYKAIKAGGYEANPVMNKLNEFLRQYTNAKWAWLLIAKALAAICILYLVRNGQTILMGFLICLYGWVIFNNIKVIRSLNARNT